MELFKIEATNETPLIQFDGVNGIFKIAGKSYPENVNTFYNPVLDYLEQYGENPQPHTLLEFRWLYYNTATNMIIVNIIKAVKKLKTKLTIKWYYKNNDSIMFEKGDEFKEIMDVFMELIEVEPDKLI